MCHNFDQSQSGIQAGPWSQVERSPEVFWHQDISVMGIDSLGPHSFHCGVCLFVFRPLQSQLSVWFQMVPVWSQYGPRVLIEAVSLPVWQRPSRTFQSEELVFGPKSSLGNSLSLSSKILLVVVGHARTWETWWDTQRCTRNSWEMECLQGVLSVLPLLNTWAGFQRTGQAPIAVPSIGSKSMSNSRTARRQGAGWDEEHCLGSFRLQAGKKLSCVSLFSGCGGLELGLRRWPCHSWAAPALSIDMLL